VNHKRIARIRQQDNLLAVRLEWFRPGQQHIRAVRIYLNLANRMTLSGLNQLWAADITYIRLACEFVYLAVVLDVFSRKVIGWALGRSLKAQLPVCALERAIANRRPPPGWCTIQIRVCNTLVRNTWKNSAIIRCCQA
jgi:transposase InsO family protein